MNQNNQTLNEPGDKTPFKVPEGYFEDFAGRMGNIIDHTSFEDVVVAEKPVEKKSLYLTLRPIIYIAAAFIVLFFSITFIVKKTSFNGAQTEVAKNEQKKGKQDITAEDYLINSVGTYTITEYYIDPKLIEE